MDDDFAVLAGALEWLRAGRKVVLATVTRTWGSAPRGLGSHMAIAGDGAFLGSVSGGCVEGSVVAEALDMITSGDFVRGLEFGVSDETAWSVGLACGGAIRVVLAPAREEVLAALTPERPCGLVLDTVSGMQLVVGVGERDQSAPLDDRRFLRVYRPPVELIVVGAVHIAQALAPMAGALGYKVTIVDPRRAFATAERFPPERFPGVELIHAWPDEVLTEGRITPSTAVLTLSHDPKIDDPALLAALMSPAFYIGALGSTRTHAQRRQRLDGDTGRIRAPIGLDIGARLPAEIAISILAEIIAARHGKQT